MLSSLDIMKKNWFSIWWIDFILVVSSISSTQLHTFKNFSELESLIPTLS